ncbi:MAG: 2-C-methyl-D-erythritol 4-phosphate cytidylyltransferase [Acidimicrobiales bacterium]
MSRVTSQRGARVPFDVVGGARPVVWGIVVAAGSGSRFGGPKQYEVLCGRRVVDWARQAVLRCCDGVVMVVPPERIEHREPGAHRVVAGGATRSASVRAGLAAVADDAEIVVVHDGARPLATVDLFRRVIDAVRAGADAAVPGVPLSDTVRDVDAGTLDRARLVAVQTPQAFRADVLRRAHHGDPDATDDAALVEAVGGTVTVVEGERRNLKITTPLDLRLAALLLA